MPDYLNILRERAKPFALEEIIASGVAILAEDTGRVLMLQRALSDEDPAAGKWEFPGGKIDPGETPILAAVREFQEETGLKLPKGNFQGQWTSSNGIYKGFIYSIPEESSLELNPSHEDRKVLNPDDPDGDNIEVIAWWSPSDLVDNPAVRDELKDTDWKIFNILPPVQVEVTAEFSNIIEFYNNCHDEADGRFCEEPTGIKGQTRKVRIEIASDEERKAAKVKAKAWIRIAPVPPEKEVIKGRLALAHSRQSGGRGGGESHGGSPEQIETQRHNLFKEFGGEKKGYIVDHQSGIKMHWTDDPQLNPNQYPVFTRGRIFTTSQGGGYTISNLLPESAETNRKRGSRPARKENLN